MSQEGDGRRLSTSSEEDDDSSDEDDAMQIDEAQMAKIMALEEAIQQNPYEYEKHEQYVSQLREAKLQERLRDARQQMHQLFPLTEQLWMDWINDELENIASQSDTDAVAGLFQEALKDYLSINLWVQYLSFVLSFHAEVVSVSNTGIATFRELCEKALTAGGLHLSEGARLWDLYRAYEQQLLEQGQGGDKQEDRVRRLFHRQLAVPLQGAQQTYAAYQEWEHARQQEVPGHVDKNYKDAARAAELRSTHEKAVTGKPADTQLLAAFYAYLNLEEAHGDPARVQCVYERAVAAFPVTVDLWQRYVAYLVAHLKVAAIINAAYARALRNCPWAGSLWAGAMRALEREGGQGQQQQHEDLYNSAISVGLQTYEDYMDVIFARAEFLRRQCAVNVAENGPRLRALLSSAPALLANIFGAEFVDRSLRLPLYSSHCEAFVLNDIGAAREVFEDALRGGLGRYYETWAAYVAMERWLRHLPRARALYARGHSRALEEGGQAALCRDWVQFESMEGSCQDYLEASVKVRPILERVASEAQAAALDTNTRSNIKAAARSAPKLSKEQMKQLRQRGDPNFKHKKKGNTRQNKSDENGQNKKDDKHARGAGQHAAVAEAAHSAGDSAKRKLPEDAPPAGADAAKRLKVHGSAPQQGAAPRATEAAAAAADADMGEAPAAAAAPTAAAPAAAAPAEPQAQAGAGGSGSGSGSGRPPASKAQPSLTGANTAFVRNLHDSSTEQDLQELFASCSLQGVRIPKHYVTGKIKGIAYLDFATEGDLQRAIRLSGVELKGQSLFVAKSNPPKRPGGAGGRGGGGQAAPHSHGAPGGGWEAPRAPGEPRGQPHKHLDLASTGARTQQPAFVPRSVAAAQHSDAQKETPKSNSEFRKMFLK